MGVRDRTPHTDTQTPRNDCIPYSIHVVQHELTNPTNIIPRLRILHDDLRTVNHQKSWDRTLTPFSTVHTSLRGTARRLQRSYFNPIERSRRKLTIDSHGLPVRTYMNRNNTYTISVWLAGAAGFEPATYGFGDRCSTRLSYAPVSRHVLKDKGYLVLWQATREELPLK